jgi:WD40 repeat protein
LGIYAVAFSPDGNYLLSGSGDNTAKLWDLKENLNQVYSGHTGRINSVRFSRNGQQFLTGSSDSTACLWDIKGNIIKIFKGHKSGVSGAAISPDGKKILTGFLDGTTCLWDLDGNELHIFRGHRSSVNAAEFSPDGQKIITGSNDATARLWDINGDELMVFKGHISGISSVAFSPDGQKILTGSDDNTARLWDLNGKTIIVFKGHTSGINSVAFSPDGLKVVTAAWGFDPTVRLWDINGDIIKVFKGHTTTIFSVSFSPDGRKILTGSYDKTAILWDTKGNIEQVFSGFNQGVYSTAFSPDCKSVLIGLQNGDIIRYPVKMKYEDFNRLNNYEKLSSFDKLLYGISDFSEVISSDNEKDLSRAAEYYIAEALQSDITDKTRYLANGIEIYSRLLKITNNKTRYLISLLNADVINYGMNPTENIKTGINEISQKILNSKSLDELIYAAYTYYNLCLSNDPAIISLKIPEYFFQVCTKIVHYPDIQKERCKDISNWCSNVSLSCMLKKEFNYSLRALNLALEADTTNKTINIYLPFAYIFNNQYDKAENILKEFKDKSLTASGDFNSFGKAYKYYIDYLEDRGITRPDFEKVKELLKK